jgi:hypothetical protein
MLSIQLITPLPGSRLEFNHTSGFNIPITAHVTLSCGAPACAGGRWNAEKIKVVACLEDSHGNYTEVPLRHTGMASAFEGEISLKNSGRVSLTIEAADPESGLAGRTHATLMIN